jgi:hypothetical protein
VSYAGLGRQRLLLAYPRHLLRGSVATSRRWGPELR